MQEKEGEISALREKLSEKDQQLQDRENALAAARDEIREVAEIGQQLLLDKNHKAELLAKKEQELAKIDTEVSKP